MTRRLLLLAVCFSALSLNGCFFPGGRHWHGGGGHYYHDGPRYHRW